jgi:hypothetical protein
MLFKLRFARSSLPPFPRIRTVRAPLSALVLLLSTLGAGAAAGASFPPIEASEKAMTEVSGSPGAPAVVLNTKAEFWMMDTRNQRMSSRVEVWRRVKVLSPEGVEDWGEIEIPHSREVRLSDFDGRTVLSDGREVPVEKDSVFRRQSSKSEKEFVTAVAFPSVEVGAILDYRYVLNWDSIYYLEPWYFQSDIPTLYSEVEYHLPNTIEVGAWGNAPPGKPFQQEVRKEKDGRRLRVWLENLPAVPDEPLSWPEEDLWAKFMLVPKALFYPGGRQPLLESWKDVCQIFDDAAYRSALRKDGAAKKKAKQIAARAGGEPRAVAEALYRFVRDEIQTERVYNVALPEGSTVDKTLEEGRGRFTEKALLLHAMLDAADIDSSLVWAPDRWDGKIDPAVPNPFWFEKVLVQVHLPGGEDVLTDPGDRRLAFGALSYHNEDVPALRFDPKKPENIVIPPGDAEANRRHAELELALDEDGRLTGTGRLELTGHHAFLSLDTGGDAEKVTESWQEWLDDRFKGWEVTDIEVEQAVEERRVAVMWGLAQRDEEVLGDEATLTPSRPLGPLTQPFRLEPERRKTPVLMSFGDVDEVRLHLTWPEGWLVEASPRELERSNAVGSVQAAVSVDEAARELTYDRSFTVTRRELTNSAEYNAIRTLYDLVEKHDAQKLVLVAE